MEFFLSYSTDADKKIAQELKKLIEAFPGGHKLLMDRTNIEKGEDTDEKIQNLIEKSDALIYLISVSSIRSFWCGKEVGYAQALGKVVIPVAAPSITMDYIKQESIQGISILKAVFWGEENIAKKIMSRFEHEKAIIDVSGLYKIDPEREPFRGKDRMAIQLVNSRNYDLYDISIFCQLAMMNASGKSSLHFELKSDSRIALLKANKTYKLSFEIGEFKKLDANQFTERIELDNHRKSLARLLLRYSPGGSKYHFQFVEIPFYEIVSAKFIRSVRDNPFAKSRRSIRKLTEK